MLKRFIQAAFIVICAGCADFVGRRQSTSRAQLARDVNALAEAGVIGVQAEQSGPDKQLLGPARASHALDDGSAIERGSRFRIASTTKTFVSALTLPAREEGKLSLDDTVQEWLPDLVPEAWKRRLPDHDTTTPAKIAVVSTTM